MSATIHPLHELPAGDDVTYAELTHQLDEASRDHKQLICRLAKKMVISGAAKTPPIPAIVNIYAALVALRSVIAHHYAADTERVMRRLCADILVDALPTEEPEHVQPTA